MALGRRIVFVLGVTVAAGACASESHEDNEEPDFGRCEETVTILGGPSEQGPTGLDPAVVLTEAEGTYAGGVRWYADSPVRYLGEEGPIPVDMQVSYVGGEIRDVDAVLVTPCGHEGPCPCPDAVEVDMQVRLVSEDRVLDETWTVSVRYEADDSYGFGPTGTTLYHPFEPDETNGSLSRASFDIDASATLEEMVATGTFNAGAFAGGLNADVTDSGAGGGYAGFGTVANLKAVTSLDACPNLTDPSCAMAGCTVISGRGVYGEPDACECNPPRDYCFAAPLQGEPAPALYTREVQIGPYAADWYNEVVVFPVSVADPPAPWRNCADAPEVDACVCFDGTGACPL